MKILQKKIILLEYQNNILKILLTTKNEKNLIN